MSALIDYVLEHSVRGACLCGQCVDAVRDPQFYQPTGHTSDLFFFKVARRGEPDADHLRELIASHEGAFSRVNPLDGKEYSYIELGAWIGDQGVAMQLMGLGELLDLWKVLTPNLLPIDQELKDKMAGVGFVSIVPIKAKEEPKQ